MKSVLISIKPQWCAKIASGRKTIEVRKSAPNEVPFKAYIYATKPKKFYKCGAISTSDELLWLANGKVEIGDGFKFWADGDEYQCLNGRVIGEFICEEVEKFSVGSLRCDDIEKLACLLYREMINYFYKPEELDGKTSKMGYAWHISDLKIYDKPKKLSEFYIPCKKPSCRMCDCEREYDVCACGYKKPIIRPPQSYMFIEEILL